MLGTADVGSTPMSHTSPRLRRGLVVATAVGMSVAPVAARAAAAPPAPAGQAAPPAGGIAAPPAAARPAAAPPAPAVSAAPSPSPSPSGDEVRDLTPAVQRQLDATVQRVMREANVPGVTVGLWTPDKAQYV